MTWRLLRHFVLVFVLLWASTVSAQVLKTGTLAAVGDVVTVPLSGVVSLTVQTSGTWAGQVEFQATNDGETWVTVSAVASSTGAPMSRTTVNGLFVAANAGYTALRVRAAALDSGTVTITATRGYGASVPRLDPGGAAPVSLPVPLCNPVTRHLKPLGKCL